jgi:hypothetical protein
MDHQETWVGGKFECTNQRSWGFIFLLMQLFFQDLQSKKGRLHSVNHYEFGPHPWLDDRFAQSATHKEHFGSM